MLAVALAVLALACGTPPSAPPPSAETVPATATAASADPPSATTKAADAEAAPASSPAGETDPQVALETAKKANKPAFIVFCATWVAACSELAHVLVDAGVKKTLDERFVVARVDVSNEDDATRERMKKYNVKGLPCLVVFDRKGKEVARESSYLDSSRLSKLLDKAK
jgi:thioredoxin:protein disulfide reductase